MGGPTPWLASLHADPDRDPQISPRAIEGLEPRVAESPVSRPMLWMDATLGLKAKRCR